MGNLLISRKLKKVSSEEQKPLPPNIHPNLKIPLEDQEQLIIHGYEAKEEIGSSEYGTTFKGKYNHRTLHTTEDGRLEDLKGKLFAMKMIDMKSLCEKNIALRSGLTKREIEIIIKLDHINIIKVKDIKIFGEERKNIGNDGSLKDKSNARIYIISEYADNGNLEQYLETTPQIEENEAKLILKQLIQGIKYLHFHNMVHGNIKLKNILISNDFDVKFSDYGYAQVKKSYEKGSRLGIKNDIESLGSLFEQISTKVNTSQKSQQLMKDLINKMKVNKELTLVERHPWFTNNK